MLQKPLEQYLANKDLDLPYCFCWANPPWTKVWAGQGSTILIDQNYGDQEQWEAHFQYMLPFFKDERYIKEAGCPLFVIYIPAQIPCLRKLYKQYRNIEVGYGSYGGWMTELFEGPATIGNYTSIGRNLRRIPFNHHTDYATTHAW